MVQKIINILQIHSVKLKGMAVQKGFMRKMQQKSGISE